MNIDKNIQNKIIIISAPSGSGKSTIINYLLNKYKCFDFSLSYTNRKIRQNEVDGVAYRFVSTDFFKNLINTNQLLEWEEVYDQTYYGTPYSEIERIIDNNKIPLLDLDVVGAKNVKDIFKENALSIFIKPPSIEVLEQRLKDRGTETTESLNKRIKKASFELTFEKYFDITIVNDILEEALIKTEKTIFNFVNDE